MTKNPILPEIVDETEIPTRDSTPLGERRLVRTKHTPQAVVDQLQLRDAVPPPPGYRYTMDGRLVPLEETTLRIDDPEAQAIFVELLEITGSMRAACDALGITSLTKVKSYISKHPDFSDQVEASLDRHRQALYAHAVQRATVGYQVPIVGGKDKDRIVGYETRVSDSLLTLLLKRHFVEFREAASSKTSVTVDNRSVNVTMPDPRKMTREQREAMRALLKPTPTEIDPSGPDEPLPTDESKIIDVVDPPKEN